MASWASAWTPLPSRAAATGPAAPASTRRRAAPSSSPVAAASPPPSWVSARIKIPFSLATLVTPYRRCGNREHSRWEQRVAPALDDLLFTQTLGQLLRRLLNSLASHELA